MTFCGYSRRAPVREQLKETLREALTSFPHLRLGQIIENARGVGRIPDLFNAEDEDLIIDLRRFITTHGPKNETPTEPAPEEGLSTVSSRTKEWAVEIYEPGVDPGGYNDVFRVFAPTRDEACKLATDLAYHRWPDSKGFDVFQAIPLGEWRS